jgi:hypothetical protein
MMKIFYRYSPYTITLSQTGHIGRAIAQELSRWLPIAAARVRARSGHVGCGGQSGTGAGFGFPCQSSFHQILHPHNHPGQVQ